MLGSDHFFVNGDSTLPVVMHIAPAPPRLPAAEKIRARSRQLRSVYAGLRRLFGRHYERRVQNMARTWIHMYAVSAPRQRTWAEFEEDGVCIFELEEELPSYNEAIRDLVYEPPPPYSR